MRLRNVKNALDILNDSKYFIKDNYQGKWSNLFKNNNPISLEIGCGKGDFLIEMAKTFPNINFIGIEKYESVLVRAIEKVNNLELNNLYFMNIDALQLTNYFNKEIDTIYLNFSDPWPKKRHAKRRLTSPIFLDIYEQIFKSNPHIFLKTDNPILFAYSLETLSSKDYVFNKVSLDLANEDLFNIPTEYETKYRELSYKINYLEAVKKHR